MTLERKNLKHCKMSPPTIKRGIVNRWRNIFDMKYKSRVCRKSFAIFLPRFVIHGFTLLGSWQLLDIIRYYNDIVRNFSVEMLTKKNANCKTNVSFFFLSTLLQILNVSLKLYKHGNAKTNKRKLKGSQIPVTTGGFEVRNTCMQSRYLTLMA